MNSFFLPFLLTLAMAVPLLWYHQEGIDPLDIAVRAPSQEEINFSETRALMEDPDSGHHGPSARQEPAAGDFIVTIETQEPGY